MLRLCRASLLLLLVLSPPALSAANLEYSVTGLDGALKRNVMAWLGEPPATEQERLNFVVSARTRVAQGLRALGHYNPEIDIAVARTGPVWQMDIAVAPGTPVRLRNISLQLLGPAANDEAFTQRISEIGFAAGDVLHHGRYESFRTSLLALGQARGYFEANLVTSQVKVNTAAGSADLVLIYDSGPRYRFGEITVDEELVDPELIDELQTFARGDYFEQSKLQFLQAQLLQTRFFAGVIVQPDRDRAEAREVPILISLQPAKSHTFDVGVGYSTDTEERVSLTWRTPKINRFGHSQTTRLEYSRVNPSGRFTYNIPLTHPLNDILQLWVRTEENEFGDIDSQQDEYGTRREQRMGNWVFGYSLRDLDESWEVLQEGVNSRFLLFGGSVAYRRHKGSLVDPVSGFSQLYTLEVGNEGLGSDVDLVRITGNLRYVFTPFPDHRVVARSELGLAEIASGDRADLPPSLNFFAGGNQSIRGFSYQSIGNEIKLLREDGSKKELVVGGDRLAVASLEYQYYFNESWRGALFIDGGDAYDTGEFDLHYGAGFGIHYITPVGAIRVELANSLSEDDPDWQLHLTVGAEF